MVAATSLQEASTEGVATYMRVQGGKAQLEQTLAQRAKWREEDLVEYLSERNRIQALPHHPPLPLGP